jgi:hypothetical protein
MSALQIWLQNHNKRLTQDAVEEALMEYIEKVERENAQLKAVIAEQKETVERGRLHIDRICNLEDIVKEQKEVIALYSKGAINQGDHILKCHNKLTEQAALIEQQKEMIASIHQAITDEENQPSQYGTVTLDYMTSQSALIERMFYALCACNDGDKVIDARNAYHKWKGQQ